MLASRAATATSTFSLANYTRAQQNNNIRTVFSKNNSKTRTETTKQQNNSFFPSDRPEQSLYEKIDSGCIFAKKAPKKGFTFPEDYSNPNSNRVSIPNPNPISISNPNSISHEFLDQSSNSFLFKNKKINFLSVCNEDKNSKINFHHYLSFEKKYNKERRFFHTQQMIKKDLDQLIPSKIGYDLSARVSNIFVAILISSLLFISQINQIFSQYNLYKNNQSNENIEEEFDLLITEKSQLISFSELKNKTKIRSIKFLINEEYPEEEMEFIKYFSNLEILQIRSEEPSFLRSFPDIFNHLKKLKRIQIENSSISQLPFSFNPINNFDLREVLLIDNLQLNHLINFSLFENIEKISISSLSPSSLHFIPSHYYNENNIKNNNNINNNLNNNNNNNNNNNYENKFERLAKLKKLKINNMKMEDETFFSLIEDVKNLKNIEEINLSHNHLSSFPTYLLENSNYISKIDFSNNKISNFDFLQTINHPIYSLSYLNLANNDHHFLPDIFDNIPNLKILKITTGKNNFFIPRSFSVTNLLKLKEISFSYHFNDQSNNDKIFNIISQLPKMESVRIFFHSQKDGFKKLNFQNFKSIEQLSITNYSSKLKIEIENFMGRYLSTNGKVDHEITSSLPSNLKFF